ncbi:MAG: hypothetical protein IJX63_09415 [Lachnospiraceae bacterium]|nr:hypothetical protein [Lachnospiraceae bacterium]
MMLQALDNKKLTQLQNILFLCSSLGALGLALYTLHDMQTAEGAGLYLSIMYGQSNRFFFDIIVDIMGMLLLLALVLLPCLMLRRLRLDSFYRFLAVYLAFIPTAHPGNAVHLISDLLNARLRESLLSGDFLQFIFLDCTPLFDMLKFVLPFLVLLISINRYLKVPGFEKKKLFVPCIIVMLIIYLLFENLAEAAIYMLHFFLITWMFGEWEATCKHSLHFANWSLILFTGCLLRGIYRMLELISHAHM